MKYLWLVPALMLLMQGCHPDPLGKPCKKDDDCGPGYDCFPDVCVQVCTTSDQCRNNFTCYRYHCIKPGTQNQPIRRHYPITVTTKPGGPKMPVPQRPVVSTPPVPDGMIVELRAIRRELDLLRQGQQQLARLIQGKKAPAVKKKKSKKK